ncbi:MAG: hypothetical protein M3O22_02515 [Pseudomonadota bacterium]|nr:hypothetical protein [Pseudomonadota bacterium]
MTGTGHDTQTGPRQAAMWTPRELSSTIAMRLLEKTDNPLAEAEIRQYSRALLGAYLLDVVHKNPGSTLTFTEDHAVSTLAELGEAALRYRDALHDSRRPKADGAEKKAAEKNADKTYAVLETWVSRHWSDSVTENTLARPDLVDEMVFSLFRKIRSEKIRTNKKGEIVINALAQHIGEADVRMLEDEYTPPSAPDENEDRPGLFSRFFSGLKKFFGQQPAPPANPAVNQRAEKQYWHDLRTRAWRIRLSLEKLVWAEPDAKEQHLKALGREAAAVLEPHPLDVEFISREDGSWSVETRRTRWEQLKTLGPERGLHPWMVETFDNILLRSADLKQAAWTARRLGMSYGHAPSRLKVKHARSASEIAARDLAASLNQTWNRSRNREQYNRDQLALEIQSALGEFYNRTPLVRPDTAAFARLRLMAGQSKVNATAVSMLEDIRRGMEQHIGDICRSFFGPYHDRPVHARDVKAVALPDAKILAETLFTLWPDENLRQEVMTEIRTRHGQLFNAFLSAMPKTRGQRKNNGTIGIHPDDEARVTGILRTPVLKLMDQATEVFRAIGQESSAVSAALITSWKNPYLRQAHDMVALRKAIRVTAVFPEHRQDALLAGIGQELVMNNVPAEALDPLRAQVTRLRPVLGLLQTPGQEQAVAARLFMHTQDRQVYATVNGVLSDLARKGHIPQDTPLVIARTLEKLEQASARLGEVLDSSTPDRRLSVSLRFYYPDRTFREAVLHLLSTEGKDSWSLQRLEKDWNRIDSLPGALDGPGAQATVNELYASWPLSGDRIAAMLDRQYPAKADSFRRHWQVSVVSDHSRTTLNALKEVRSAGHKALPLSSALDLYIHDDTLRNAVHLDIAANDQTGFAGTLVHHHTLLRQLAGRVSASDGQDLRILKDFWSSWPREADQAAVLRTLDRLAAEGHIPVRNMAQFHKVLERETATARIFAKRIIGSQNAFLETVAHHYEKDPVRWDTLSQGVRNHLMQFMSRPQADSVIQKLDYDRTEIGNLMKKIAAGPGDAFQAAMELYGRISDSSVRERIVQCLEQTESLQKARIQPFRDALDLAPVLGQAAEKLSRPGAFLSDILAVKDIGPVHTRHLAEKEISRKLAPEARERMYDVLSRFRSAENALVKEDVQSALGNLFRNFRSPREQQTVLENLEATFAPGKAGHDVFVRFRTAVKTCSETANKVTAAVNQAGTGKTTAGILLELQAAWGKLPLQNRNFPGLAAALESLTGNDACMHQFSEAGYHMDKLVRSLDNASKLRDAVRAIWRWTKGAAQKTIIRLLEEQGVAVSHISAFREQWNCVDRIARSAAILSGYASALVQPHVSLYNTDPAVRERHAAELQHWVDPETCKTYRERQERLDIVVIRCVDAIIKGRIPDPETLKRLQQLCPNSHSVIAMAGHVEQLATKTRAEKSAIIEKKLKNARTSAMNWEETLKDMTDRKAPCDTEARRLLQESWTIVAELTAEQAEHARTIAESHEFLKALKTGRLERFFVSAGVISSAQLSPDRVALRAQA